MKFYIAILFFLLSPFLSVSNNQIANPRSYDEHSHDHAHAEWEVALASGGILLLAEEEFALGLHLHLLRRIPRWERLSLGLGVETILDEHTHLNSAIVAKVDLWKGLGLALSPGILFLKEGNGWEREFSSHFEVLYEFNVGNIHLGPVLGYSSSQHDSHIMLGLHLGLGF